MSKANYLRETVDLVKQIDTRALELGARLYRIKEERMWEDEHDSFMEFVDTTGLKRSFVSMLTTVHRVYVVDHGVQVPELAQAGYSKLYDAMPLLDDEDAKTVVNKAKMLSLSEIREEVRDEKHPECSHEETVRICSACHKRV